MKSATRSDRVRSAAGFTLLETLVALILIGIGYTMALGAMSGSLRLTAGSMERENAARLARMRLDEYLVAPDAPPLNDDKEEQYGGTTYAYKIEVRPIPLIAKRWEDRLKNPVRLEEISIAVYWGKAGEQRYVLSAYKAVPGERAVSAPGSDKPAAPPSSAPVATPKKSS